MFLSWGPVTSDGLKAIGILAGLLWASLGYCWRREILIFKLLESRQDCSGRLLTTRNLDFQAIGI